MQVGRTAFTMWAFKNNLTQYHNFQRILTWLLLSAVFWIAGALAHDTARLGLWAFALFLEYLSPTLAFWTPWLGRSQTSDWDIEGGHMAERCGLFVIIALGESLLVTGATFSELEWTPATMVAFAASFVGSVALWWLYFDASAEAASETISTANNPGRLARSAYTYMHLFIIAGIVISAVADEFVLAHPTGHTDTKTMLTVLGGPGLYLIGNILFKWAFAKRLRISHLTGLVMLALLVPVAALISPAALIAAASLVLVGIAAWEARAKRQHPEAYAVRTGMHQG
jgi:low temperature requirement protein LtrA